MEETINSTSRKDKFKFAHRDEIIHDTKFETKPVSYLHDCMRRFVKNKASVVGAIIILLIILFSIFEPIFDQKNHVGNDYLNNEFAEPYFANVLPRVKLFDGTGFWDGTKVEQYNDRELKKLQVNDSNYDRVVEIKSRNLLMPGMYMNEVKINTYAIGCKNLTSLTSEQYQALVEHEKNNGTYHQNIKTSSAQKGSIMKPLVDYESYVDSVAEQLNLDVNSSSLIRNLRNAYIQNQYFFKLEPVKVGNGYSDTQFRVVEDENGNPIDVYLRDGEGNLVYEKFINGVYTVRVDYYDYVTYKNGFEPIYTFGANQQGKDICLRLAKGASFSLMLGICITLVNFIIGLIWGAISGYYGGRVDLIMERFTDIISNIPTVIIMSIANIQFVNNEQLKNALGPAGIVVFAIFIAFIYNGWVGVASTTRMQFYRFKGQEYVLASRTLGAKDSRLIFKHILPNATGTLVTRSVLMIPGIIFSEASLSYLGIINFESSGIYSIGSMLNEGKIAGLANYPHILLFPSIIICLLMISFNLFGNGLRDAFNTTLRGSED